MSYFSLPPKPQHEEHSTHRPTHTRARWNPPPRILQQEQHARTSRSVFVALDDQPTSAVCDVRVHTLITNIMIPSARRSALLELSKKRAQIDDLAPVLWGCFGASLSRSQSLQTRLNIGSGAMSTLLIEVTSAYSSITETDFTTQASIRVCSVLALMQSVASHNITRQQFLKGTFWQRDT